MVAKITTPKRLVAALNYNEHKVGQGRAECLHAANFLREANTLSFYQKHEAFERLNELNERATTKTLHVSLNFSPTERLTDDRLKEIACEYMDRIGFGDQPFLVYKHLDAGHPHMHIVSTTIRGDGRRISTHNIGSNQSEKARKEIEVKYGLIKAENQKRISQQGIRPIEAEKVVYGKAETKRSITNVVNAVLCSYNYTSLAEFNAILSQFNVVADRGVESSRTFKHRGLYYRVVDNSGDKIGVPIKASAINSKPTLNKLESHFRINGEKREVFKQSVKDAIDEAISTGNSSLQELKQRLQQKNIHTVLRQNGEGKVYGITFVDNRNKVVFNGSDLGKKYSAAHLETCRLQNQLGVTITDKLENKSSSQRSQLNLVQHKVSGPEENLAVKSANILHVVFEPEKLRDTIPFQLLKKKRRRKRKLSGL